MTALPYGPTSTATLSTVVEGVLSALYGQTAQVDAATYLTASITASATTFTVDDAADLSAGLIEIDTELLRVLEVDRDAGTVTIAPTGRGRRGTVAATHASGAEVRVAPIVPYSSVVREIQAELHSYYPRLCAVNETEFTSNAVDYIYALPADAYRVLDVRYKDRLGDWQRLREWEIEHGQNATDFPNRIALRICLPMATTVRVIYGKPFGELTSLTDSFASAGVPQSLEDVIRMGAQCRLLPSLDISRLSVTSTSSSDANGRPPTPGTGVMVAREIAARYRERLEQEIKTFRDYFPVRQHYTR